MKNPPTFSKEMHLACQKKVDTFRKLIETGNIYRWHGYHTFGWSATCKATQARIDAYCPACPLAYFKRNSRLCGCIYISKEATRTYKNLNSLIHKVWPNKLESAKQFKIVRARLAFLLKRFRAMGVEIK